jgi:hypothetical protein
MGKGQKKIENRPALPAYFLSSYFLGSKPRVGAFSPK